MSDKPVRLLVVDDHDVVRFGLVSLFNSLAGYEVVAEATTVADAIAISRKEQPDVVVLDVRLPDGSGVEACRVIRSECPATRVLMLTSYSEEDAVIASIVAGAAGYILKQTDLSLLVKAVETVSTGGSLLDPIVTETVVRWMQRGGTSGPSSRLASLSDQERRILSLIAEGKTNREIAGVIFVSESTVKTHVSSILRKLELTRRSEAAAFLARRVPNS